MKSITYKILNLLIFFCMINIGHAQNTYYNTNTDPAMVNNNTQYNNGQNQNNGYGQQPYNQQFQPSTQVPNDNSGLGTNLYQGNRSNPSYTTNQNPNAGGNPGAYSNNTNLQYNPNNNPASNAGGYANNTNQYQNPNGSQQNFSNEELKDFGVQPTSQLYSGSPHGPTPSSIPGGKVITTNQLKSMVMSGQNTLIFDVLGGAQHLPGAIPAAQAAAAGSFSDQTQQMMGQYLSQATQGNKQANMVYYCQSNYCWMSYNAALRAINLGYTNVYWYRGGIEAWQSNGLTVQYANNNRNY